MSGFALSSTAHPALGQAPARRRFGASAGPFCVYTPARVFKAPEKPAVLAPVTTNLSFNPFADRDFVIEAVVERALKAEVELAA